MVLEKLYSYMQKNHSGLLSHTKNSKWIKDIKVRPEIIKLLEKTQAVLILTSVIYFGYSGKGIKNKNK